MDKIKIMEGSLGKPEGNAAASDSQSHKPAGSGLASDSQSHKKMPAFNIGDTVKIMTRIPEGDKVRLHPFEGTVIARRGSGACTTFTVRKVSFGEGIERVFPLYSPAIESIKVSHSGKVKRAKLYYLRSKIGKETKIESALAPRGAPAEIKPKVTHNP